MLLIETDFFFFFFCTHTRRAGTGNIFLNLNNAHYEFMKGRIKLEGKHEENAWVSFFLSPQPTNVSYKGRGRGRVRQPRS